MKSVNTFKNTLDDYLDSKCSKLGMSYTDVQKAFTLCFKLLENLVNSMK